MYDNIKIKSTALQQNKLQQLDKTIQKNHDFQSIFHKKLQESQEVKISKHAMDRLEERNITLTPDDLSKLNQAMEMASKKGIRETLIMMDNRVFVASVRNNTVITAAVGDQLKDNVFTNIDGAVII
ncbi:TIGR02530 family flagellar biosynthesis protein [Alkaliphilus serpentinus]|uniref:Flagellar protein n=1 Tax=Alkaliphilus serpentinus TaxID=1482731 RepID=A0A833M8M2_9FIRM|nr:TIGR02530 family flagellar biosynthesis protein [Alkaliphilus serpentinus]KAB3531381.1 flagellar protein [Alkaliphilus serpentinus]